VRHPRLTGPYCTTRQWAVNGPRHIWAAGDEADDLGVRAAIKDLYGLDALPDRATCLEIAVPWRPYATIGSWYCWRSLDLERNVRQVATGYPT
jgi:hypothetical protein